MRTAGIVHKICLENFLCHNKLEIEFNPQINFIIGTTFLTYFMHHSYIIFLLLQIGKNGSGKSAVLTGMIAVS